MTTLNRLLTRWAGGFSRLGKDDGVRYIGNTRDSNNPNEYPLPFSPELYLPRACPDVSYSTNPVRFPNEQVESTLDSTRVLEKDKIAHGPGKLMFYDCLLYEGMFCDGYRHGQGRGMIFEDSRNSATRAVTFVGTYVGNWRYSCRNGRGAMTLVNGTVFDGIWVDDKPNGPALLTFADGSTLLGVFSESLTTPQGGAIFTWGDGSKEYHLYGRDGRLERHRTLTVADAKPIEDKLRAALDVPSSTLNSPSLGGVPFGARRPGGSAIGGSGSAAPSAPEVVASASAYVPQSISSGASATMHESNVAMSLKLKTRLREFSKIDGLQIAARLKELGVGDIAVSSNDDSFINCKENGGTAVNMLVDPRIVSVPLIESMKLVATDELSKDAVKTAIKAIVIVNDDTLPQAAFKVDGTTLSIKMPLSRGGQTPLSSAALKKFIESAI